MPAPSPQLTLPKPTGHSRLGTVTLDRIDTSRRDPWVPAISFRELIVQLWYPAHEVDGHPREPYFTPITARAYSLLGSEHATFTDFAVLVPQVATIIGLPPSTVIEGLGTINGDRAVTVERAYIRAWFDKYLSHHDSHLLNGPPPRFPEVQFVG